LVLKVDLDGAADGAPHALGGVLAVVRSRGSERARERREVSDLEPCSRAGGVRVVAGGAVEVDPELADGCNREWWGEEEGVKRGRGAEVE
jgi:hypothetical protein